MEDHAPVRGTRGMLVGAKEALGIPLHERPSASLDLNPIEADMRVAAQEATGCSALFAASRIVDGIESVD